jgi:alkylhydroperoxidase family enzyme
MEPRLPPVANEDLDDDARAALGTRDNNVLRTIANHPKLLKRWSVFAGHVLSKSTLSGRDRELLILRTGWNCSSPYEWGQHVVIAREEGVTDDEIARIALGPEAAGWQPNEAALLRAADQLHDRQVIDDATYGELAGHYDDRQLLDIVFAVGQYHLVSMALNTFRVERDDGVTGVPVPEPR